MSFLYALVIGLNLSIAYAIEMPVYISTPNEVTAGTSFEASLNVEMHNGGTTYVNAFRVYLGISYQEKAHYFFDSDCYLIHEQTLCDPSIEIARDYVLFTQTPFNVTVPTTVGPSGAHYVLMAQIHQTDGSRYGASLESDVFKLTGANGTWSSFQENSLGRTLWGDDGIPCGSYACVKKCADASVGESNATYYQSCANGCPNVSIDFENSTVGGQPTASLTKPSACAVTASGTAIDAKSTTDGNTAFDATRTRSATAAAATSMARSTHEFRVSFSTGLLALLLVVLLTTGR